MQNDEEIMAYYNLFKDEYLMMKSLFTLEAYSRMGA